MATHEQTNGRTWTPVLSILALITGVSAVVSPMGFGLLNLAHTQEKHDTRINDNQKAISEIEKKAIAEIRAELAAIRVQFAEIETQFKGQKSDLASVDGKIEMRLAALDKTLQQEIKNVSDINALLQANQKDNITSVQAANNRLTALETYLRFRDRPPMEKNP